MKKIHLLFSFCLLITTSLIAQNFVHEFGKYSGEEFKMERYANDPTAEAVVIYDIGQSDFRQNNDGFRLFFEKKIKIKIFTKAGLKYANFEIPYYTKDNDIEVIEELEGNTYNYENGAIRKTALDLKNTFIQKDSEHWMNKKFAMPDVKEGSIIEVHYKIISPYFFNFRSWEFQNSIPIIYSEYVAKMTPFYEYTYILNGTKKIDNFRSYEEKNGMTNSFRNINYNNMNYEFIMKDVPAFKDESFITSANDYMIKLDFQLAAFHDLDGSTVQIMTTWPKMIEDMLDHESFGKYQKAVQKKALTIIDTSQFSMKSANEKAKYIDKYLKSNYNWNGQSDKFASRSVKDFLKTKSGNSSDINLFYAALLNSSGIEAYPVLISTRNHGKIQLDYPFQHFFNYVIVAAKIDNQYFPLDATEPLSNFNEIPSRCFNDKGLIIKKDKGKSEWINLKSEEESTISYLISMNPKIENDTIYGKFQIATTGYDAINIRKIFMKEPRELKNELSINNLTYSDSIKGENLSELDKPFEVKFDASLSIDRVEDKLLISPFCNFIISENPLKQPVRTSPIDMVYKKSKSYVSVIKIPEGYKLFSNPANLNLNNNDIKIQYLVETQDKNSIKVTATYEFKKDSYETSAYFDIKGYFNKIIEKFNEKIVFVKI